MTVTSRPNSKTTIPQNNGVSQNIEVLRAEVERDSTDLVAKISLATALAQARQTKEAMAFYQEVVEADPSGVLGASALKAIESLDSGDVSENASETSSHELVQNPKARSLLQGFYNLPINRKQLVALLVSQLVSLLGLGVGTRFIVTSGLHTQLVNQAKSELAVTEVNYNIKINQMGFGFRGQSDNPAIIAAAKAHAAGQLPTNLRWQVKKILQNEIKARTIEYATLVGRDSRIIINANANRTGEIFNPNNLVQEVFTDPRQIKASAIVSWAELVKENPPLPTGFAKQDALIRYTVTPVKDPVTKTVIGALISGDIVNGKQPIVKETLKAFKGATALFIYISPLENLLWQPL